MQLRSLLTGVLVLAMVSPALASSDVTFNQVDVRSALAPGKIGFDSGVPFSGSGLVRISASGSISLANNACPTPLTPNGCNIAESADSTLTSHQLGLGTLEAAFTDDSNSLVTNWTPVGEYAALVIPSRAKHLIYAVNGVNTPGIGTFHVVTDIAPSGATAQSVAHQRVGRSGGSLRGVRSVAVQTPGSSTADVQYLLRRFGFSATPAQVAAIVAKGGADWWLDQQAQGLKLPETGRGINGLPGSNCDSICQAGSFETREISLDLSSNRQLLQKVTWHWLEHFNVGFTKIHTNWEYNGGTMQHYIETVRNDALGNFQKLITDVSKEPAILIWLDNLNNNGNDPNTPPNENFARELLQLYTIGPWKLHSDATLYTDYNGNPIDEYSSADIKILAHAVSGWTLKQGGCDAAGCAYPKVSQISVFNPANHATGAQYGSYTFIDHDHTFTDPGNAPGNPTHAQCAWDRTNLGTGPCVIDNLIAVLARDTNTGPFESKELIQRFANENPSRQYVWRIANVWSSLRNDPNQIAKVVIAIAKDPEFYKSRYTAVKEPIERTIDMMRELGGADLNAGWAGYADRTFGNAGQPLFDPSSVFGFYIPGPPPLGKSSLLNTNTILANWSNGYLLTRWPFGGCNANGQQCRSVDLGLNNTGLASLPTLNIPLTKANADLISTYLLNAMVDGGNPGLQALISNYISGYQNSGADSRLIHALWVLLTSPEYEVN